MTCRVTSVTVSDQVINIYGDVVLIVGPNNVGKSIFLKELFKWFSTAQRSLEQNFVVVCLLWFLHKYCI